MKSSWSIILDHLDSGVLAGHMLFQICDRALEREFGFTDFAFSKFRVGSNVGKMLPNGTSLYSRAHGLSVAVPETKKFFSNLVSWSLLTLTALVHFTCRRRFHKTYSVF